MKLLIITQKVDKSDPILGFFHRWIEEFAKTFEKVTVICLERGHNSLIPGVKILSLGKEDGRSKAEYIRRFYQYIWDERHEYDTVFVHMNPEYMVLGGALWRLLGKRLILWYVHKQKGLKLFFATMFSHRVFTSSKESFRLKSSKVRYVGHGIIMQPVCGGRESSEQPVILHVGRITPIKRCEVLIEAISHLRKEFPKIKSVFVGAPITTEDRRYMERLEALIREKGLVEHVEFAGSVPPNMVRDRLCSAHATVNLAPSGGMDKAVLESLSVGVPAFFVNKAFLGVVGDRAKEFHIDSADPALLSRKIREYLSGGENISEITQHVREYFSIPALISRIVENL